MKLDKTSNLQTSAQQPALVEPTSYSRPWSEGSYPEEIAPSSQLLRILWAHKFSFLTAVVVCMLAAMLLAYGSSPEYRARGSIELEAPPAPAYSVQDAQAAGAAAGPSFDSYLETQIGILQSDSLIRRVVIKLNLAKRLGQDPQGPVAAALARLFHKSGAKQLTEQEAFEIASRNLEVRQARLNNLVEILYTSKQPQLAADFVNALAETYTSQNLESRWDMAQSTGNWLAGHLAGLQTKLEDSENALQRYSRSNGLLLVSDDNGTIGTQRLTEDQQELLKAQSLRMEKEAEMDMAKNAPVDSIPAVLDNEALREYEIKLADLQRQLAEAKETYTAANPKVKTIQSQIASIESALEKQRNSVLARLNNEYKAADRNEKMLAARYDSEARLVSDQDQKMIRYQTLKHEVDTNRTIYESLLQKVKESGISTALQATNVRMVDAALPPVHPSAPNRPIDMGAGLLAGVLLGLTSVGLRNKADRRVHKSGIVEQYLGPARELGIIPSAARKWLPSGAHELGEPRSSELRAWKNPESEMGESFRSVMASLLFATESSGSRVVVVTSARPAEGKTTVVSNLGAAFAATGKRVLIIDADLRRARLHEVFGLRSEPGLIEFICEIPKGIVRPPSIEPYVQWSSIPGLFVMTAGNSEPSPIALHHTLRLGEAFAILRDRFDIVLLDAPPLLCVAEARVMSRLADGVVLVVRAGKTRVDEVVAAERSVRQDGGVLIGAILNDVPGDHPFREYASTRSVS